MNGQARRATIARAISRANRRAVKWAITSGCALAVTQTLWLPQGQALAAEENGPAAGTPASASTCPAAETVWAAVADIVPRAAPELQAAKPRVSVIDLDEQYRVRIMTVRGTAERTNTDPARDCDKRARFVAEFIVLTLLPPQLARREVPAAEPARPTPPSPPPPASARPPRGRRLVRIEIGAAVQDAPRGLGAPSLFSPGAEARVRIGTGPFAAVAGVAVYPAATFDAGGVRASMMRVPSVVGLRTRFVGGTFELVGDLALSVAFEAYSGVSVKMPRDSARLTPGVEGAMIAAERAWSGLALFAGLRCALFPITREIGATPRGTIGSTPSVWLGGTVGLAIEP